MDALVRTQIQLTEEQHRQLKALAAREGVSLAELVRRGVEVVIAAQTHRQRWERFLALAGTARDEQGVTDLARDHDRYLDEAFSDP